MACTLRGVGLFFVWEIDMKPSIKNFLIITACIVAFGIVGHMDYVDGQCSWNGCGDARYTQE